MNVLMYKLVCFIGDIQVDNYQQCCQSYHHGKNRQFNDAM